MEHMGLSQSASVHADAESASNSRALGSGRVTAATLACALYVFAAFVVGLVLGWLSRGPEPLY